MSSSSSPQAVCTPLLDGLHLCCQNKNDSFILGSNWDLGHGYKTRGNQKRRSFATKQQRKCRNREKESWELLKVLHFVGTNRDWGEQNRDLFMPLHMWTAPVPEIPTTHTTCEIQRLKITEKPNGRGEVWTSRSRERLTFSLTTVWGAGSKENILYIDLHFQSHLVVNVKTWNTGCQVSPPSFVDTSRHTSTSTGKKTRLNLQERVWVRRQDGSRNRTGSLINSVSHVDCWNLSNTQ